ncbi:hypothetical protein [Mycobacterium marinum]|uniref:hypothetical protein n=1 Tax=Mycobacterium marinum TaxID=1781 RepID=UPI00140DF73C|nr:hypothetical protein [Mycobacterium marinum]
MSWLEGRIGTIASGGTGLDAGIEIVVIHLQFRFLATWFGSTRRATDRIAAVVSSACLG